MLSVKRYILDINENKTQTLHREKLEHIAPHRPLLPTAGPAAEMSNVIYFLLMITMKIDVSDENQELQTTF